MKDQESFEVVYEAQTEVDASIAQAILEDAGITVVARPAGEGWRRIYLGQEDVSVVQLLVPAEMSAQARLLLAAYQQQVEAGAYALEDEEEEKE